LSISYMPGSSGFSRVMNCDQEWSIGGRHLGAGRSGGFDVGPGRVPGRFLPNPKGAAAAEPGPLRPGPLEREFDIPTRL
jgi:hypothetical protein